MKHTERDISNYITNWIGTPASVLLHSLGFIGIFILYLFHVDLDRIMLILTTAVSLEAIYLSLFIQMTVNRQFKHLENIGEDTDEILEDTTQIVEDTEELTEPEDHEGLQFNSEDEKV